MGSMLYPPGVLDSMRSDYERWHEFDETIDSFVGALYAITCPEDDAYGRTYDVQVFAQLLRRAERELP